jgi:ubiquinone/menaquinone biosynthesis C-methylase UbiE
MASRDNRSYYDEFAAWYEKERHHGYHRLIDDLQVDLLSPAVAGSDVLEVGCGTGLLLERVAPVARSARGIDLSPGMLQQARERGLDVVEGCATDLPFEDETFDVVYSFKVLAHVEDIRSAVRECCRVTRPGGALFLEFYNPHSLRYLARTLGGAKRISESTRESAVFTRWDEPARIVEYLPAGVALDGWAGVRIFTPAAVFHRVPLVATALRSLEFVGRDTPLGRFGGFLVARARKQGPR